MKKLIILKSIIDFIWFVTCIPLIPIILFLMVYQFIDANAVLSFISTEGLTRLLIPAHLIVTAICILVLIGIYSFYLFRKTIRYFQKRIPFHAFVSATYYRIGRLLIFIGVVGSILMFTVKLLYESKLVFNLGLTPYLFAICLGLFFMVLSETFKVARVAQDENNLTI